MIKEKISDWIKQYKVIAIIKGVGSNYIVDTVNALYEGGIRTVEITLNSPDSLKSITIIREKIKGKVVCGAGTVMTAASAHEASVAGAQFVSCIHSDPQIIREALEMDRVIIAGAFTPSDIIIARNGGADFINIFPSITLGPDYFKQIKSPFGDQFFFAVGGISVSNAPDFLKAGAKGIAIGNNLVNPKFIKDNNYAAITEEARKYVKIINEMA